jgi:hypothetical protein
LVDLGEFKDLPKEQLSQGGGGGSRCGCCVYWGFMAWFGVEVRLTWADLGLFDLGSCYNLVLRRLHNRFSKGDLRYSLRLEKALKRVTQLSPNTPAGPTLD